MSESRKWIDLYPGKTHEFGTRVRILGHARMNDNAVRLYYEEVVAIEARAQIVGDDAKEEHASQVPHGMETTFDKAIASSKGSRRGK